MVLSPNSHNVKSQMSIQIQSSNTVTQGFSLDYDQPSKGWVTRFWALTFIKIAAENPVLWTGMKGASAESRKKQTRC
jgi:hypothetical protein